MLDMNFVCEHVKDYSDSRSRPWVKCQVTLAGIINHPTKGHFLVMCVVIMRASLCPAILAVVLPLSAQQHDHVKT